MALQSLGYLHLDLSSRNILAGIGPNGQIVFALADYGLTHKVAPSSSTAPAGALFGTFLNWAPGLSVRRHTIPSAFIELASIHGAALLAFRLLLPSVLS